MSIIVTLIDTVLKNAELSFSVTLTTILSVPGE